MASAHALRSMQWSSNWRLREDALRNQPVHAHRAVHQLGDVEIHRDAGEHVGVLARHPLFRHQEIDRLAHRILGGRHQVAVDPHDDPVRRRLGARPLEVHVLADDHLDGAAQRCLHRGDVDLAIALAGMSVADLEQRARHPHRNEERRAGDEVLVVEVAGVNPRRRAVDPAHRSRRCHADAAEERMHRDVDPVGEVRDVVQRVERDDPALPGGEVLGDEPAARAERVVRVADFGVHRDESHLEHVA